MNIKTIKNTQDHQAAVARLSALMSLELVAGSDEENELQLLALVIEDFERQTVPPVKADPIEFILFRADQMQLSRKDLVPYIGSLSKVSEVLSRKRPLSLPMIRRLKQGLGIPADILIEENTQAHRFSDQVEPTIDFSRFPFKEMHERGCFGEFKGSIHQLKAQAGELIQAFMQKVCSPLAPTLLRAPLHQRGVRQIDEIALLAWRMCVLHKAQALSLPCTYKAQSITPEWLRHLAQLSALSNGPHMVADHLAHHGIALVIEAHFKRTYLDGAAMLDKDNRPIVALTLRHDRLDNFWFALLHELAHVAEHLDENNPVLMDDLSHPDADLMEAQADALAQEALIPQAQWELAKVRETLSPEDAISLATEIQVHPAIVAGRLRREQNNYHLLPELMGFKTGLRSE
jgi:HTH-type transcriptional regulator / antitoxin HigA